MFSGANIASAINLTPLSLIAGAVTVTAFTGGLLLGHLTTPAKPSWPLLVICDPTKLPENIVTNTWRFDFETESQMEQFTQNSDTYEVLCATPSKSG